MKKLVLIILVLANQAVLAQNTPASTVAGTAKNLAIAKISMDAKNKNYNPSRGYAIYKDYATRGNAEAMNAMGMIYSNGLAGVTADTKEAFNWFTKAANANYGSAWYNLALMYKNGIEIPQSDQKAYECFSKGAALNNRMCLYGTGYMLYKGLGVKQDYTQAYQYFEKGVARKDEGAMYMLGLCFRNGYGVAVNIDSARYWLTKAAGYKDKRAIAELADVSPENADIQSVPDLQPAAATPQAQPVNLKSGFRKVNHRVDNNDLTGSYNGFVIKFDWSGRHIISQSALKLNLQRNGTLLTGIWTEAGQPAVTLSGTLTDTALVFNNTSAQLTDHYHKTDPQELQFKNSLLNLVKSQDTVYLSGNLSLYSPKWHENQRPEFIMLIRTNDQQRNPSDYADTARTAAADALHFVAYPNPFSTGFQLRYTLKKADNVSIIISDLLSGRIVYRTPARQATVGDHTDPVSFNGQPGNYVVTLQYGNKAKSIVVIKQ